jgi:hypothetical protein
MISYFNKYLTFGWILPLNPLKGTFNSYHLYFLPKAEGRLREGGGEGEG